MGPRWADKNMNMKMTVDIPKGTEFKTKSVIYSSWLAETVWFVQNSEKK